MIRDKKTGRFVSDWEYYATKTLESVKIYSRNSKGQFVKRTSEPTQEEKEAFWEEK